MARPTSSVRKLTKTGNGASYSITIPIDIVRKKKWKERQKLIVIVEGRHVVIKDWKKQVYARGRHTKK